MKTTFHNVLILAALGCASAVAPVYATPPTVIANVPYHITVPGKYVLNNNLALPPFSAVYAIYITCSNVTVDLSGYTITGPGGDKFKCTGIIIGNPDNILGANSNILIKNGTLANFGGGITSVPSNGLSGYGETNSTIKNVTMTAIDIIGILDVHGVGNHIENCVIFPDPNLTIGIKLSECTNDVISGNQFHPTPIYLPAPYQSIIVEGTVKGNTVRDNEDVTP